MLKKYYVNFKILPFLTQKKHQIFEIKVDKQIQIKSLIMSFKVKFVKLSYKMIATQNILVVNKCVASILSHSL